MLGAAGGRVRVGLRGVLRRAPRRRGRVWHGCARARAESGRSRARRRGDHRRQHVRPDRRRDRVGRRRPVLVDVDDATFTLDPATLEDAVTEQTRAVVPVHLYGQCADMEAIAAFAQGARLEGRRGRSPGPRRRVRRQRAPGRSVTPPPSASIRPRTSAHSATPARSSRTTRGRRPGAPAPQLRRGAPLRLGRAGAQQPAGHDSGGRSARAAPASRGVDRETSRAREPIPLAPCGRRHRASRGGAWSKACLPPVRRAHGGAREAPESTHRRRY